MKYLATLALLITFSHAQAEEIKLNRFTLSEVNSYRTEVDTSFFMNTKTREGFVDINVFEDKSYPYWGPSSPGPMPEPVVLVYSRRIPIPNLKLEGDQIIYHLNDKKIDCGYLGVSRIFKLPKIFLTGSCNLSSHIDGTDDLAVVEVSINLI